MRQLSRLHARNLDILTGIDLQFWLFEKDECHAVGRTRSLFHRHHRQYQQFYFELDRNLRELGITFEAFHMEDVSGRLKLVLSSNWGIVAVDNLVRLKLLIKDTAEEMGFKCSFMSQPQPDQLGASVHFKHSIWERGSEEEPKQNVMLDVDAPLKVRYFFRKSAG